MKEFEKMTRTEALVFCLMSVCSGLMIGIGGVASLLANNLLESWGKVVGAALFSLGIFAIVTYEMRLFTGMVADIPNMGIKNMWRLPVCFLGNILGVAIVTVLAYYSPVADKVVPQAQALISGKLSVDDWAIRALCSSILCGILITTSVWSVRHAPKKTLSASVGVMFPIIVFAFCGFDHSVANMLYFYYLGEISGQIVGYILLTVVGNVIGGVILPFIMLLKGKTQTKDTTIVSKK